ncbi:TD and POZ domain-containing protein 1-like [Stegodyphus dumicola]|uniref:TD and POZ domain-containing protein 1-like n=1 Tax=Stegodyphus dumicola TaxID=202533 RepID=UPI0015AC51AE|nr:TD and POZ domain-containing protein 1-like [Stegodyphus dumicola]
MMLSTRLLYAMERPRDDDFTFTWIIQNISMCHELDGEYIYSPSFTLNSLPGMKWRIELYPRTSDEEYNNAVTLQRKDFLPEPSHIKCRVEVLDCDEKSVFRSKEITTNSKNRYFCGYLPCFIKTSFIEKQPDDVLIIKYTLTPICESDQQAILPPLPYKNGLFTDLVLRTNNESFKVHKAILWARWPKLSESLDRNEPCVLDIKSDVLDAILKYVYTGKIDFSGSELLPQVYAAAVEYELPNMSPLPVMATKARTRINAEKISFDWPIENLHSLPVNAMLYSHVFTVQVLPSYGWNLIFHMREISPKNLSFTVSVYKVYGNELKTVFMKSKISFLTNNEIDSCESEHLFQRDFKWQCAKFSVNRFANPENELLLKCELKFSNRNYFSEILESSSCFPSSINCHYFKSDLRNLFKSGNNADLNIKVGSKTFLAHKFILCARSSVFSRMFETEMIESRNSTLTISDADPDIIAELLLFMYCGFLEKPLEETAMRLYTAADKYDVLSLKKKCSHFLKGNLSVENVCKVLRLADLHSDEDLYVNAFTYFIAHASEIFLTDEWVEVANDHFWVTLLENMNFRTPAT